MSQRVMDEVGRLAWSVLGALSLAMVFLPACVAVANAQPVDGGSSADSLAMLLGVAGPVAWPFGLALGTEFLRSLVPAWRRGVRADPRALAAVDRVRTALAGEEPESLELLQAVLVVPGDTHHVEPDPGRQRRQPLGRQPRCAGFHDEDGR